MYSGPTCLIADLHIGFVECSIFKFSSTFFPFIQFGVIPSFFLCPTALRLFILSLLIAAVAFSMQFPLTLPRPVFISARANSTVYSPLRSVTNPLCPTTIFHPMVLIFDLSPFQFVFFSATRRFFPLSVCCFTVVTLK